MTSGLHESIEQYFLINGKSEIYNKRHLIAGWLFEFNKTKREPIFFRTIADFDSVLHDNRMPKTPMQRLERLLLNLYKISDRIGAKFVISTRTGDPNKLTFDEMSLPISIAYAINFEELVFMFDSLAELSYIRKHEQNRFFITPKGYERAEQLINSNIDSKSVFVAMDYRDIHVKEAFESAFKPACAACGFDALIIRDKPHNNGITDEIIVEIKKSKFVIVDFTFKNNGAYWEAGYAQGLGRPIIRSCKKDWFNTHGLHFDVKHYRTIIWEDSEHLIKELKENIRANIIEANLEDNNV